MENTNIKSEARYTFMEATGVLLGHEVGAGILTIPFLASLNNWWDFIWILGVTFLINTLLHLMIAELSLNNNGAQFVECMRNELFKGKDTKASRIVVWIIFIILGAAVIFNCTAYITGAASALESWFGLQNWAAMLIYYAFAGLIVMFGMKIVGISEKISMYVLVGVIVLFGVVMLFAPSSGALTLRTTDIASYRVVLGLYSIVSFAMSAVMSVPTVVKGLNGDKKKIRNSIILSEIINSCLIVIITLTAVIGAGAQNLTAKTPASVDLGNYLNTVLSTPWVGKAIQIFGYVFSIFAYSTSLWANTLDLRDMVSEQTKLGRNPSWLLSSAPALILAIVIGVFSSTTLSKLSTLSGGIQVLTGVAIVWSFAISRAKERKLAGFDVKNTITGIFGNDFLCIVVILSSLVATVGSIVY